MPDDRTPLIGGISDTARWVAAYRARETERRDALFHDPLARRLAGEQGERILSGLPSAARDSWAFVTRTVLIDRMVADAIARGIDTVVNLAAGLDTRPYRMALPASLRWVEVDLPDLLAYKARVIGTERPRCDLERVPLDLADVEARRALFTRLGTRSTRALVLTEGLLLYLSPDQVASLARDLAGVPCFESWLLDLLSPGLVRRLARSYGRTLAEGGAVPRFAPAEGQYFFQPYGWRPVDVRSYIKAAARLKRLPFWLRPFSWVPESSAPQGSRPWSAAILLVRN